MQELLNFAHQCGFTLLTEVTPDGQLHRFKVDNKDHKESGYYIFFQNYAASSGQQFHAGIIGNWRGEEYSYTSSVPLSKGDREIAKKKMAEASKKAEAEKLKKQEETAKECQEKWGKLTDKGESPYFQKKGLEGLWGCRLSKSPFGDSITYIPMRDVEGKLWSLQSLTLENKFFYPGGRVKGCYHIFGDGRLEDQETIYIAEGSATAGSCAQALGKPVVCTFDAGNLVAVASELKGKYTDKTFIICGDEDQFTVVNGKHENAGREKAEEAAKVALGITKFPVFKDQSTKPTDFNDLHALEGIEAVRAQIQGGEKPKKYAHYSLGFKAGSYFFTTTHNEQIVEVTAFSEKDFLHLMPLEYWERLFPAPKGGVSWSQARSLLMEECRAKGIFESRKIRGAGVWSDAGRVVVNMGDHLVVDGVATPLHKIQSEYFYTLGIKLPRLHSQPLTVNECMPIREACNLFKWQKPDFGYLLAGAMVTTRICGALPIRPHVWVTGEKGAGKSTLFNRLIYPLIGEPLLYLAGNSTEAGIRQEVSANAVPVLFDEFENNGVKSAESMRSVIDLLRVAWSETNAVVLKGSAGGVAQSYQARFAAIVTSIRPVKLNDADRSRFATIELAPHGSDLNHWKSLDALLNQIDMEYGNRLFARTIKMLPILLQNFKTMKRALNRQQPGQRFSDQYGMLLAGYGILLQDNPLSDQDADLIAQMVPLEQAKEDSKISDQDSCLQALLTKKISLQEERPDGFDKLRLERVDYSFEEAMRKARTNSFVRQSLESYGIKVEPDSFAIRTVHTELENLVFKGTRWSESWGPSLLRLSGAKRKTVRCDSFRGECIVIQFID